jgi:hypothetical protein
MSGNKIPIQKPGDELTKNAHYNWQLYNYFVGCVLFSRCLVLLLHAPGSWHDIFKAEMLVHIICQAKYMSLLEGNMRQTQPF